LREKGKEFGSTTGRARRTGWLDLVALKYAIMLNGVTDLIMMKSDVLDGFDTIKAAVAYNINGEETQQAPYYIHEEITPIYKEFKGWDADLSKMLSEEKLPAEFLHFIRFIEDQVGLPIKILSVGPDREQTIVREIFNHV